MKTHFLKIVWVTILLCYAVSYAFLLAVTSRTGFFPLFLFLLFLYVLGVVLWGYLTIRVLRFRRGLVNFLRHVFSGNYQAGVPLGSAIPDEINRISDLINKVTGRLRTYDTLRQEKVAVHTRALEIISKQIYEGLIIADIEKKKFTLNPVARVLFGTEHEEMTFSALGDKKNNAQFMELFKKVVEKEKVPQEKTILIELPIGEISKEISVKIFPLKDRTETVKSALIFVR